MTLQNLKVERTKGPVKRMGNLILPAMLNRFGCSPELYIGNVSKANTLK